MLTHAQSIGQYLGHRKLYQSMWLSMHLTLLLFKTNSHFLSDQVTMATLRRSMSTIQAGTPGFRQLSHWPAYSGIAEKRQANGSPILVAFDVQSGGKEANSLLCYSWQSLLAQSLHPVPSPHVLSYVNSHLGHEEWKEEKKGGRKKWSQETGNVTELCVSTCPLRMEALIQIFLNPDLGFWRQSPLFTPSCLSGWVSRFRTAA